MRIIPAPKSIKYSDGEYVFNADKGLSCPVQTVKENFNDFLFKLYGFSLSEGDDIVFSVDESLNLSDEGYLLEMGETVKITGKTERGLFYGVQTFKQLVAEHFRSDKACAVIQRLVIEDEPRFSYRGFMFDCCRHFFGVDVVKRYIQAISIFKINKFHWHLTEDQGWRVEIDGLPKLTEVGSKRKESVRDGKPVEGYFTKEDIAEVVRYAAERYIDVVPEFDMPGHTTAAIAAYPELSCDGTPQEVATRFGVHSKILCGGKDESYEFINKVLTAYADLFPGKLVHLGGDEAVKNEWYKCEKCQQKIKELGLKNEEELQAYMTNSAIKHLVSYGKTAICWNESANAGTLDDSAVLQFWNDGEKSENVVHEVKRGRKIIVSKFNPYYLDYPYAMWSLKDAYSFEPVFDDIKNYENNVLGVEAPIWTEYVDNTALLAYRVFPRLLAVAETGWSPKENKDYALFVSALPLAGKLLKTLDITPADLKESNPKLLRKITTMLKFGTNFLDLETIKRSAAVNKEMKKMRAIRKGEEKDD